MEYFINIDIGGTHTDGIVIDQEGNVTHGKVSSTPDDFSRGFFASLEVMAEKLGMKLSNLLDQTRLVSHGTTVGTNAVIEGDEANAALVTTRGTEYVLFHMRGSGGRSAGLPVEEYLDMQQVSKPDPLIQRREVYGVDERVDSMGDVVVELNEERAREVAQKLADKEIASVAVSFLWSFLNPDHEKRMKEILREELGDAAFITLSSELAPRRGEFERTAASAINAVVSPLISEYITNINRELTENGYEGTLLVMQVGGGLQSAEKIIDEPVKTIDSGPAAGLTGCAYLANQLEQDNVIAADMGGTSFDVGLVTGGKPITNDTNVIQQHEYSIRNIDVHSIGNGGGSIAWVDDSTGRLRVGPQSAGANPGPACYDQGGKDMTVTDADLLCGYLDPSFFLGGRSSLSVDRARSAAEDLADRLGMDVMEVAKGIKEISIAQMADLISQRTTNKGYDPRQFTIYAYGGAGPLHVPLIAKELEIGRIVVPIGSLSSVWSAVGISTSDVLHRREISNMRTVAPFDPESVSAKFERAEEQVRNDLFEEGFSADEIRTERHVRLKYSGQVHELTIPAPNGPLTDKDMDLLLDRFEQAYQDRYGEGSGASYTGFELTGVRCDGYGETTKPNLGQLESTSEFKKSPSMTEKVFWPDQDQYLETAIFYEDDIGPGLAIEGPAVMRLENTTAVVPSTATCEVDSYANIIIEECD